MTFTEAAEFIEAYRTAAIVTAGVVMVALAIAGGLSRRHGWNLFGKFCDTAAVAVAVALSAEGMWEAATEKLGLGPEKALLLFAFAELAMLRAARRARKKVDDGKRPGVYGLMVWGIALAAGLIATSNAPNMTEHLIRLGAPLLVAAQWFADLVDKLREKAEAEAKARGEEYVPESSQWIWTPRRIGVHLGLIRPGRQDLKVVDRERRVGRLVRLAAVERSGGRASRRAARRLDRLALTADALMVAEAAEQLQRALTIRTVLFGDAPVTQSGDAAVSHPVSHDDASGDAPGVASVTRQPEPAVSHPDASPDASGVAILSRLVSHADAPADATPVRQRRRPGPRMSPDQRLTAAVEFAHNEGVSARQAALKFSVNERTVQRRLSKVNGSVPDFANTQ